MKGAAPKLSYFEQLFPLLRKWGASGICIEYEDMFPFDGFLRNIKHKQAYTKEDIAKINKLAKDNHLDVMPLLQTYGKLFSQCKERIPSNFVTNLEPGYHIGSFIKEVMAHRIGYRKISFIHTAMC